MRRPSEQFIVNIQKHFQNNISAIHRAEYITVFRLIHFSRTGEECTKDMTVFFLVLE